MRSKRRVWLVGMVLLLFLAGVSAGADNPQLQGSPAPPARDAQLSVPSHSTSSGSPTSSTSSADISSSDRRSATPLPEVPGHTTAASQIVYIYVQLIQPIWLNPPPIRISEHSCSPALVQIKLDSLITGADRYNIYRDTLPMFTVDQFDSAHNLIGYTTTRYFDDNFSDPLWIPIGSRGVCDPRINYYYVATTIDSISGGFTESRRPSNCVGEFDYRLYNKVNWIPYALDIGIRDAGAFASRIGGATRLEKFDNITQSWIIIARWVTFPPPARWVSSDTVSPGYAYRVSGTTITDSLLTLAIPGLVPEDRHYTLKRGRNLILLPFRERRIANIRTGAELGMDIGYPPAIRITTWDGQNQVEQIVARWSTFPPPARWVSGSGQWGYVRAGYPYNVICTADRSEPWPPVAR